MSDKQTNKRNNKGEESDLSDSCLSQKHPSPSSPAQVQISQFKSQSSQARVQMSPFRFGHLFPPTCCRQSSQSHNWGQCQQVSELAPGGRGQGVTIKGGLLLMIGLLLVQMVLSQWWGVLLPFWGSFATRALSLSQLQLGGQQVNRKSLSELGGGVSGAVVCSAIVVL